MGGFKAFYAVSNLGMRLQPPVIALTVCLLRPLSFGLFALPCCPAVAPGSNVTVTCRRVNSLFPAAFQVTVIATAAGASSCPGKSSWNAVVAAPCCASGVAYARNSITSTCLACSGAGFVNNITSGSAPTVHQLLAGNCSRTGKVGTVPMQCTNVQNKGSNVTLGAASVEASGDVTIYFFVGCGPPMTARKCSPQQNFGADTCTSTACGGLLTPATQRKVALSCACAFVRWIVAAVPKASSSLYVNQVGGTCPV